MTTMDDDLSVATYDDLLVNFGAAFAATQETMKGLANGLVVMQNQLLDIQLCMNVGQHTAAKMTRFLSAIQAK